ncbi:acyl-CoA thioesterase [Woeseia oceani]|uniref:Acyl-CoA thioesterase n=1 Tax=Woeseia oceani TaxID=1548547 RepID=A0A193LJF9_9GAMM|nr:acyl-CoA thioesterase [Woeseia oceani]ANO52675.1 acyl-CoA thioesterase [Woeseia oceani]
MKGKSPADSAVEQNVYKVFPNDLNSKYTVFGGLVMGLCDRTALIVAERHSGHSCVTAAVDSLNFLAPAKSGETLIVKAAVNRTWRSSMEIGVHVAAENSFNGDRRHVVSAYLTFVALDENGAPVAVPAIVPQSDVEKRRYEKAGQRRDARLAMRTQNRD